MRGGRPSASKQTEVPTSEETREHWTGANFRPSLEGWLPRGGDISAETSQCSRQRDQLTQGLKMGTQGSRQGWSWGRPPSRLPKAQPCSACLHQPQRGLHDEKDTAHQPPLWQDWHRASGCLHCGAWDPRYCQGPQGQCPAMPRLTLCVCVWGKLV